MTYTRESLLKRIRKIHETGCWEFQGSKDHNGFGRMYIRNRELKAHKVFYEAWVSELPTGIYLHHDLPPDRCIGNACCNPEHMSMNGLRRGQSVVVESARVGPSRLSRDRTVETNLLLRLHEVEAQLKLKKVLLASPANASIEINAPKRCPKGHVMTPDNIVTESRKGHPKQRCRTCRQESWRKNSAKRKCTGLHT
jgi:hypothetical protein